MHVAAGRARALMTDSLVAGDELSAARAPVYELCTARDGGSCRFCASRETELWPRRALLQHTARLVWQPDGGTK